MEGVLERQQMAPLTNASAGFRVTSSVGTVATFYGAALTACRPRWLPPPLIRQADVRCHMQRLPRGCATVGQLALLFRISRPAVSQPPARSKRRGLVRQQVDDTRTSAYELKGSILVPWDQDAAH
jgi:hypothetical protein